MIKERQLVPGRMLAHRESKEKIVLDNSGISSRYWVDEWTPCMVISYVPEVRRRHSKSNAERSWWDVLVFWFDARSKPLDSVRLYNSNFDLQKWKIYEW